MPSDISMRALFSRPGVPSDEISLRAALANHPVSATTVRTAAAELTLPDSGSGFASGCREEDSSTISIPGLVKKNVGGALPAWVDVKPRDHRSRVLEGTLRKAKMTDEDFPLRPWHTSLDWNFFVQADPQYQYIVSQASRDHNSAKFGERDLPIIECEWESALIPLWAVPQEECRIWMVGRWIYDCGHPENRFHRTEIHPPKAIASFRSEAALLPGNPAPTPVTRAALYIGRHGGYIDQQINQTHSFDLHLPPKLHPSAEPRFSVVAMTGTLPVQPRITPYPEDAPKLLRVVVPLAETAPIDEYGAVICGGWSDPDGAAASRVRRVRVTIDRITRTRREATEKDTPDPGASFRTWHLHLAVNGRWRAVDLKSAETRVNFPVDLLLTPDDRIRVTAFGIERRNIFEFMGAGTGLDPSFASQRQPHEQRQIALKHIAKAFRDGMLKHGPVLSESNVSLGLFSSIHSLGDRSPFTEDSARFVDRFTNERRHNNYVIEYRIEEV